MSTDLSSGDSTPKLVNASIKDLTLAVNEWYRMIELNNDLSTPIIFNKGAQMFGSLQLYNHASAPTDYLGLTLNTTGSVMAGRIYAEESTPIKFHIESGSGLPLVINGSGATNYIVTQINGTEIVRVTSIGLGIGMTPAEKLSIANGTNGSDTIAAIYAANSGGTQSFMSFTQEAATANSIFRYGRGALTAQNLLILRGSNGNNITMTPTQDIIVNAQAVGYQGYTNAHYVSIYGGTAPNTAGQGVFEVNNYGADANSTIVGAYTATDINSTALIKQLGAIEFLTDGTTANNRGGAIRFMIKPNGASGPLEAARINNARQLLIGANTAIGSENVRIHAGGGAKLSLSDSNNQVFVASVPVSTSSELSLGSNNTEGIRLDKNQNVGIQQSVPAAKLDIGGNAAATMQAIFARGSDLSFQLHAATVSGTNTSGDTLFQLGTRYIPSMTLTGGMSFTRGGSGSNMTVNLVADSQTMMSMNAASGVVNPIRLSNTASMGQISTQTNTTTAGLVLQTASNGVVGTDGAFATFINKDGTKAFSLGMDFDGDFKVGGGSFGTNAYKVWHDGYNPGAMVAKGGTIEFTDADLYRPTGMYRLHNQSGTASYSILEFADIGGSSCRVQQVFLYGNSAGSAYSGDEMYFRVARDTQTNWDGYGVLGNRVWHSSNLVNPLSAGNAIDLTSGFHAAVTAPVNVGEVWVSTPSYSSTGDGKTHFGYKKSDGMYNFLRGDTTWMDKISGRFSLGQYPFITGSSAYITTSYAGGSTQFGLTLNNLSTTGTAVCFLNGGSDTVAGTVTGSITVTAGATAYNQTSDLRLKTNIRPAQSATQKVMDMEVIEYEMKAGGASVEYGYGAQTSYPIIPQAIKPGSDGDELPTTLEDTWQMDNSKIVPMLHKALQESIQRVSALEEKLEEQQEFIVGLLQEVARLRKGG